jgi:hypothetical protein
MDHAAAQRIDATVREMALLKIREMEEEVLMSREKRALFLKVKGELDAFKKPCSLQG